MLDRRIVERIEDEFGIIVMRAYGSSEVPVSTSGLRTEPRDVRHADDGVALDDVDVRVGSAGDATECCIRGPHAFLGYTDADDDALAFDGEWFRTGDVAEVIGRQGPHRRAHQGHRDPQRYEDPGGRGRGGGRADPRGSGVRGVLRRRLHDRRAARCGSGARRRCRDDARRRHRSPGRRPACPSTSCPRSWCSGISRCRSTPTARSSETRCTRAREGSAAWSSPTVSLRPPASRRPGGTTGTRSRPRPRGRRGRAPGRRAARLPGSPR